MARKKKRGPILVALLAGGGALLAFAGTAKAGGGEKGGEVGPPLPGHTPADLPRDRAIGVAVCDCFVDLVGSVSELAAELRLCAARRVWPTVQWPPREGDHPSVREAWGQVDTIVYDFLDAVDAGVEEDWCEYQRTGTKSGTLVEIPEPAKPSLEPQEIPKPSLEPLPPIVEPSPGPVDLGPWEVVYPRGGKIIQIRAGDIFLGEDPDHSLMYRQLLSDSYLAALEDGASEDDAKAFARSIAENANRRVQLHDLTQCSWWNDVLYATYGYGFDARPSPHGRAIRLLPIHVDNRARIASGEAPFRNIQLGDPSWKKTGKAGPEYPGNDFEFLWLVELDYGALRSGQIAPSPIPWPNAPEHLASRTVPPPEITMLGIEGNLVPGRTWGCGDSTMKL